jgi:hypothetical protein
MLTDKEMEDMANAYIEKKASESKLDLMLFLKHTIKRDYGNLYNYNTRKFIEEKDYNHALIGNGSFLVEKKSGKIFQFGTAKSDEYYFAEYEGGRWKSVAES